MDRFIVPFLSHPYTRSVNLKSNMDRFIVHIDVLLD